MKVPTPLQTRVPKEKKKTNKLGGLPRQWDRACQTKAKSQRPTHSLESQQCYKSSDTDLDPGLCYFSFPCSWPCEQALQIGQECYLTLKGRTVALWLLSTHLSSLSSPCSPGLLRAGYNGILKTKTHHRKK